MVALLSCLATWPLSAKAQGAIAPGENKDGTILPSQASTNTFAAAAGDRIILQFGKITGGAGFTPKMELFGPDGTRLAVKIGSVAARLDIQAAAQGTYSVVVSDVNGTGSGTFRLRLLQFPGSITLAAGDEGGPLTNGVNQPGTIDLGDLDAWTIQALAGDRIVLQVAKTSGGAGFSPLLELMAPNGTKLADASGGVTARVDVQAPESGTYTAVISDLNASGTGGYEMHLAQVPETFIVPANDEGGPVTGAPTQEGTITVGDLDLWTFTADGASLVNVQVTKLSGGAGFTPRLEVFGPDGQRKAFRQDALTPAVEFATETAGTYTILVSDGNGTGAGTYRLGIGQSALVAAPGNPLANGLTSSGNIATAGTDERWSFTASAGDSIVLRVGEGVANSRLVPQLRLFAPGGALMDSATGQAAAEVAVRATNSGIFSVSVRDNNAGPNTGTYRITLAKTGTPLTTSPSDEGGTLINATNYVGSIETGDIDTWSFTANAGESIVVRMGEGTSTLTPQLRLFDPSGTLLESGAGQQATEVSTRATNSGTFLVIVGDLTSGYSGTGSYRLNMIKTGSPLSISPTDEGGAMTNGSTYTGSIELGDMDAWSFPANAGDTIILRMGEGSVNTLVPQLRLFDPSGVLLDSGAGQSATEVTTRATNSGTFLLIASDLTSGYAGTGNYQLTLAKTGSPLSISPNDEGGFLTNGTSYLGSIEVGDIDPWIINANAGDTIIARMGEANSTSLVPQLRLFDPSGVLLDSAQAQSAAEVSARATNSGAFLLVAGDLTSGYAGSGNYRLSIAKTGSPVVISPNDEGGELLNGSTTLGTIDVGDIDAWTFNAKAGESIALRMGEVTGTALVPQLRLFDPSGVLLDSFAGQSAAEVTARATNNGTFLVVASDLTSGWAGSGNYRITLAKTGTAVVVPAGQEGGHMTGAEAYEGTIETGGLDVFSFTACAGETIALDLKELVNGSPLTPWLRLWGRDGVELKSLAAVGGVDFTLTAPASGAYTVLVGDRSSGFAGSGTYRLTATGLSDTMRFCVPRNERGQIVPPTIIGGTPAAPFTLLTSTNIVIPLTQWTTSLTNQFDQFGIFTFTNAVDRTELHRFFQLRTP